VREAVADVAELALLGVLEDGVELLLLGDLELGVGPAGDLDNHVEDGAVLVGEEGDIVEGRDDLAVLLEEGAELCRCTRAVSVRQDLPASTSTGRRKISVTTRSACDARAIDCPIGLTESVLRADLACIGACERGQRDERGGRASAGVELDAARPFEDDRAHEWRKTSCGGVWQSS
jgi:hypothetical protein